MRRTFRGNILSRFPWKDTSCLWFWFYCNTCYFHCRCSRFNNFPVFWISNILLSMNSCVFFFYYPFLRVCRIRGMILFTVYPWKWFTAIKADMSYCTALTTSEISCTWCFRVIEVLPFKTVQRVWTVGTYGTFQV